MMKRLAQFVTAVWLVLTPVAAMAAFAVDETLEDPVQEKRAVEIQKQLRCLVCQNQAISDSDAELARDLRRVVRERIAAGDADDEVVDYMVARYGDWVMLKPPFKASTYILWGGPFVVLLLAFWVGRRYLNRVEDAAPEVDAPLSADEEKRLDELLKGKQN